MGWIKLINTETLRSIETQIENNAKELFNASPSLDKENTNSIKNTIINNIFQTYSWKSTNIIGKIKNYFRKKQVTSLVDQKILKLKQEKLAALPDGPLKLLETFLQGFRTNPRLYNKSASNLKKNETDDLDKKILNEIVGLKLAIESFPELTNFLKKPENDFLLSIDNVDINKKIKLSFKDELNGVKNKELLDGIEHPTLATRVQKIYKPEDLLDSETTSDSEVSVVTLEDSPQPRLANGEIKVTINGKNSKSFNSDNNEGDIIHYITQDVLQSDDPNTAKALQIFLEMATPSSVFAILSASLQVLGKAHDWNNSEKGSWGSPIFSLEDATPKTYINYSTETKTFDIKYEYESNIALRTSDGSTSQTTRENPGKIFFTFSYDVDFVNAAAVTVEGPRIDRLEFANLKQ